MTRTLMASFLLVTIACHRKNNIEINRIADKTPKQVAEVLGEPDTAYTQTIVTKPIFTQIFTNGHKIEIMYPEGLATDIVVHNPSPALAFERKTLAAFGLKIIPPTDSVPNAYLKWKNYPGFKTINFFVTKLDRDGKASDYKIFLKTDGTPGN